MARHASPFESPSTSVERAWSHARSQGGPVDTGVAEWGTPPVEAIPPREEEYEDEPSIEDGPRWFEGPGGSSELGRSGPSLRVRSVRRRRLVPGVPGWPSGGAMPFGGASELSPGGASELSR